MIDVLLKLETDTCKRKLRELAGDAPQSTKMVIVEEYRERLLEILRADDATTVEDKVAAFDKMRAFAISAVEEMVTNEGYSDDDTPHYAYETLMIQTLGREVFDTTNYQETAATAARGRRR